jgi:hypothetical protein
MTAEMKKELEEQFCAYKQTIKNKCETDYSRPIGLPAKIVWHWFESKLKSEIAEACKKQREADAEIFKGYCALGQGESFAYEDDFNIYCKILANASPLDEVK